MASNKINHRGKKLAPNPEDPWDAATSPAVAELLDHVAEELAREFVRLMEKAAADERGGDHSSRRGEA